MKKGLPLDKEISIFATSVSHTHVSASVLVPLVLFSTKLWEKSFAMASFPSERNAKQSIYTHIEPKMQAYR